LPKIAKDGFIDPFRMMAALLYILTQDAGPDEG
jgi:hypothetical protein